MGVTVFIFGWIWQDRLFLFLTIRNHIRFIGINYLTPGFRNRNYGDGPFFKQQLINISYDFNNLCQTIYITKTKGCRKLQPV